MATKAKAKDGIKNRIIGLEMVKPEDLRPHPKNWRVHPDNQKSALQGVLESVGIADASLAYRDSEGQLTLIDGHLRKDLLEGHGEVPVLVTDLNDTEAEAILASHDVVTTMAVPDKDELDALLESVKDTLPRDVLVAIDPDFSISGEEIEELTAKKVTPKYPIVPQLDEGYDFVLIFSTRERDFAWLQTVLDLPTKRDKNEIGMSRVLTVDEFKERWYGRDGS